jgi:hypothetical protein
LAVKLKKKTNLFDGVIIKVGIKPIAEIFREMAIVAGNLVTKRLIATPSQILKILNTASTDFPTSWTPFGQVPCAFLAMIDSGP